MTPITPPAPADESRELTVRGFALGLCLALILGAANAYLGLYAGMTVSASIPAAVISMAILRMLGGATILENNVVQTDRVGGRGGRRRRDLHLSRAGDSRQERPRSRIGTSRCYASPVARWAACWWYFCVAPISWKNACRSRRASPAPRSCAPARTPKRRAARLGGFDLRIAQGLARHPGTDPGDAIRCAMDQRRGGCRIAESVGCAARRGLHHRPRHRQPGFPGRRAAMVARGSDRQRASIPNFARSRPATQRIRSGATRRAISASARCWSGAS